jgi:hypothetical protein
VGYSIEKIKFYLAKIEEQDGQIVAYLVQAATREWFVFDKDHNYIKLKPSKNTGQGLRRYASYMGWQKHKSKNSIAHI